MLLTKKSKSYEVLSCTLNSTTSSSHVPEGEESIFSLDHHQDTSGSPVERTLNLLQRSINDVRIQLGQITQYINKKRDDSSMQKLQNTEWRNISRVCDRMFFLIYLCAVIFSLFNTFPRPFYLRY